VSVEGDSVTLFEILLANNVSDTTGNRVKVMHKVFYEAATVMKVVLLLTLIPHTNRQGRNSYFLDLHYPDSLAWCLFSHFHQALRSFRQN